MEHEHVGFVRARRPEQKQQRREAILDAARTLGRESGVRNVTLGSVALAVGLAKSNVVRYFGTREEIFLELTAEAWADWERALTELLGDVGAGSGGAGAADGVVAALAQTLAERPFLCDLLSQTALTLEHNVSLEAARVFKRDVIAVVGRLGARVADAHPELDASEGAELISAAAALAGVLYPLSTPPAVMRELYAQEPDIAAACPELLPTLERSLAALAAGLPTLRGRSVQSGQRSDST
ncbi:TetR/AcrR family transcriptional regulator [Streptomyces sp. NPDC059909]|uniref:TetR/AcrR family transcriptional regulator n=1 Tax=Streptomyces sp. NPDC059909 TaxID=3346998 RepID=UPI00365FA662